METNRKIKLLSSTLAFMCLISIIGSVAMHFVIWWIGSLSAGSDGITVTPYTEWQSWKWLGFVINSISLILFIWAIKHLRSFFKQYYQGNYFSLASTIHFQRFSWFFLAYAVSYPFVRGLSSVTKALVLSDPELTAELSINTTDISLILIALVFLSISWLMFEAAKLKHENSSFV